MIRLRELIRLKVSDAGEHVRPRVINEYGEVINPPDRPTERSQVSVPEYVLNRATRAKHILEAEQSELLSEADPEKRKEKIFAHTRNHIRDRFLRLVSNLPTKGSVYRMGEEQDVVNKDQIQFNVLLANFGNVFRHGLIDSYKVTNKPERTGRTDDPTQTGDFNLLYRVWADNMATV